MTASAPAKYPAPAPKPCLEGTRNSDPLYTTHVEFRDIIINEDDNVVANMWKKFTLS